MILTNLFQRATGSYPAVPSLREVLQSNEEDIDFFASLEQRSSPWAFFCREEIDLGEVLHKGQFHTVHAINGFQTSGTSASVGCPKRQALVQQKTPFQYSLKTLHSEALIDPKTNQTNQRDLYKAVKEMVDDAKYLSRLQHHPNILNVHGLSRGAYGCCLRADREYPGQSLFMITDRIHETLAQRIHQWRLMTGRHGEPNEDLIPMKANYAFQIAKALKHCHDNGILLRGLQPSRVAFVTEPHVLQLTDFGLAREFPPRQQQHHQRHQRGGRKPKIVDGQEHYKLTLAGTRRYLAGEVLTTGEYTLKSDTYCWAMVWYEMLTERKPYHGLSSVEHQRYVCEGGERPDLSNMYLPDEIDDILVAAWHPVLSQRLTMDQVCEKMQAFLMNLDVHYYDQREEDFLFDVEVRPSEDLDDISEIELDQYLIEMQQQQQLHEECCYETSSSTASLTSLENALAEIAEEERLFMASFKSLEDSRRRTLTPSVDSKPRKVISEAA